MKLNNTFVLFDSGGVSKKEDWQKAHAVIQAAVEAMAWPAGSAEGLVIPKIVSIKKEEEYIDKTGKTRQWKKKKALTLRNGVVPLKELFRANLQQAGWKPEEPLSLAPYFETIRADKTLAQVFRYPVANSETIIDALHEGVGDFDFWLRSPEGFRTVVEWETGNISSSHRSLNKICLALMGDLIDAAVVIVPSNKLSVHLTDRVGNIRELQPYFYFWSVIGRSVNKGLLAVIEVEHDSLFNSKDARDFIPRGDDGNAPKSGRKKRTTKEPPRKRAKRAKGRSASQPSATLDQSHLPLPPSDAV